MKTRQETELTAVLRENGLRVTPLRRKVLEILMGSKEPLSHTEIFGKLAAVDAPDRVSLYRTLTVFVGSQIVHQILGTDGVLRFCVHDPFRPGCPGNHPHFLCRRCGHMICLPDQSLPRVDVPEGTEVEGKQLLIFGLCAKCAGGQ